MNLHGIVAPLIGIVNPFVNVTIRVSNGSTNSADGTRVPRYFPDIVRPGQVQSMSASELRQYESLNLGGARTSIYFNGAFNGTERLREKGGDLMILENGFVYLTTLVIEQWPDWCKVAVVLQDEVRCDEDG